jgi:hypothetical protein
MSWFSRPKDEKPSEEDYDLNGLNDIHSRTKGFLNVGDYEAKDFTIAQRREYLAERGMELDRDVVWDQHDDTFKRRR